MKLRRAALSFVAASAALLAAVALAPLGLLLRAATGGRLEAESIGGTLFTVVELHGVSWRQAGVEARARRAVAAVSWDGLLRRRLIIERLDVEGLRAAGVFDPARGTVDARWRASGPLGAASGSVRGAPGAHDVSFAVEGASASARASGRGSWAGGVWRARWRGFSVGRPIVLRAERPFTTAWTPRRFAVDGLALRGGATRLSLSGEREGELWRRLDASLEADLAEWARAGVWRSPLEGRLSARARLTGDPRAPSGRVEASLTSARYLGVDAGAAALAATLDGTRARVERLDWRLGEGTASAEGVLPLKLGAGADFDLRLRARRMDLSAAARRLGAARMEAPRLDADLSFGRAAGVWTVSGGGRLEAAGVGLPAAGVDLGPAEAEWTAQGDRFVIRRSSFKPPGRGASAALSGEASSQGPSLRVTGERLPFDSGRGLTGEADAVVDVAGSWRAPSVTGTAFVRRGEIAPRRRWPAVLGPPAPPPSPAALDLRLAFDRGVWYRERGSALEFKGDLRLRKKPFEPARLLGSVETVRGEYGHVGRVFRVEEGVLRFGGGPVSEAVLLARGLYVDEPTRTKVRLALTGTLAQPKLSLSSQPPMEERDIVSFLMFGRPLYEVDGAQTRRPGGAEEAAKLIGDYLSQGLRAHLPPQLGVDVLRIGVRQRRPDVTVGRYLSRRLFVSYGQTMGEDRQKRLSAAYALSPRWSLETENTNQGRSLVDLLFNWGFR